MPENDDFSRDLGYLDKFFDKLESHAGSLPSDAGQRLRALLADERKAWAEIKQLVGGGDVPAAAPPPPAAEVAAVEPVRPYTRALQIGLAALPRESAAPPSVSTDVRADDRPALRSTFTIGSLKSRR